MLLIDGYNLLHVTGFQPQGRRAGELREAREGLLTCLAKLLDPSQYPSVTIVFDAHHAPRRLPAELTWRHLQVYFARDHASADEMIETLIRKNSAPKKLTVVSSDHRIQVAAKRRGATYVDSDVWFDALLEAGSPKEPSQTAESLPTEKEEAEALLAGEDWSAFFAAALDECEMALGEPDEVTASDSGDMDHTDHENPFPPGYFDNLVDEFPDDL